jgi:hypothetical protein
MAARLCTTDEISEIYNLSQLDVVCEPALYVLTANHDECGTNVLVGPPSPFKSSDCSAADRGQMHKFTTLCCADTAVRVSPCKRPAVVTLQADTVMNISFLSAESGSSQIENSHEPSLFEMNNKACEWLIQCTDAETFASVQLHSLETEEGFDFITILGTDYRGQSEQLAQARDHTVERIATLDGDLQASRPDGETYVSTGSSLLMQLETDSLKPSGRFEATVSCAANYAVAL